MSHLFYDLVEASLGGKQDCSRQYTLDELVDEPLVQPLYAFLSQDGQKSVERGLVPQCVLGAGLQPALHHTDNANINESALVSCETIAYMYG